MRKVQSHTLIFIFLFISGIFGYVLSNGNENTFFHNTTSGKSSNILQDILKQESSLHFSLLQKIQNLVLVAIDNKNNTDVLRKEVDRLKMIENRFWNFPHTVSEVFNDFRKEQNATHIELQNVPPLLQAGCILPFDCFEIYNKCGLKKTGVYDIYPLTTLGSTQVLCDMDAHGGGWTVFQHRNRANPRVNFNTTWDEYKRGFGYVGGNYWLGNDAIHILTTKYNNSLFIRLKSTKNESFDVQYSSFSISAETDGYRLSLGEKSGKIGDAFRSHTVVGHAFYTFDHDTSAKMRVRCATTRGAGWWYDYCNLVNLNAPFFEQHDDPVWYKTISKGRDLYLSEMLIRRI